MQYSFRGKTETLEETRRRFMTWVVIDTKTGCWYHRGSPDGKGYPRFPVGQAQTRPAHIVSYELFNGPVGFNNVLHDCDNIKCSCPQHLKLGSQGDNIREAALKGRMRKSRLQLCEIEEIKRLYRTGMFTQKFIGKMFRCGPDHINRIINGSMMSGPYAREKREPAANEARKQRLGQPLTSKDHQEMLEKNWET